MGSDGPRTDKLAFRLHGGAVAGEADDKQQQLEQYRVDPRDKRMTTDQGVRVDDTDNSLRVGERGPTLLEDFHFREKIMRFDHERIPERVVHARGAGAYGQFRAYDDSLAEFTVAAFLTDPSLVTPTFVRFSTVAGSRGSADTVRDVRGFATKFYTRLGNYDLVGNNMPVFFIQDAIKFPDFVHSVKPEPHNEIPQAQSAHDTFWDFVQLQPESLHMVMWLMSDRAIPRSFRMMQGFGVHTFRLVNAQGRGTFVKFHWKPMLGTHSLVWDEVLRVQGNDPDFNRRDLWDAIAAGAFPEYELGVQLVPEADEHKFDFDLLDATKIIPEEEVPVRSVGKMVLNRNPNNFFAETEQIAFCTANVVPGIDFTNDPLLQGRNFSYLDTQLIRLGGPNFPQIPINRPIVSVYNDQRDGYHQHMIYTNESSYSPNTITGGCPMPAIRSGEWDGVFKHYQERVDGEKIRKRSPSFDDHYSQATLFWNSMADWEKRHIVAAFRFELGHVERHYIKEKVVEHLGRIDGDLAAAVAAGLGIPAPKPGAANHGRSSPALSQANTTHDSIATRKIAVLAADGTDASALSPVREALEGHGAICEVLAPHEGTVGPVTVDKQISAASSVLYDAVLLADGGELANDGRAVHFVREAFRHGKAIGALPGGRALLEAAALPGPQGVIGPDTVGDAFTQAFTEAIAAHRHYDRDIDSVPA
ncbi:catalase [Spongiactinospora sp. TRM90649]|uniref:catalase n=1 Tax=Spongiactinospora sp. TRM90649 TaxID=3031114 RepID=UPI0023F83DEA|nr:catalase [Spongiactinospora sp. TRM90649]MDF5758312.1 catalase [Spongiactinospora sp. TRM90649]